MFFALSLSDVTKTISADEHDRRIFFRLPPRPGTRTGATLRPHSLRHACASHLLDEGFSIKEIGDHLGHRSPRSTQIYAKVQRKKLAQVADAQLSSLTEYLRAQTQPITVRWANERLRSLREVSNFGLGGLQ